MFKLRYFNKTAVAWKQEIRKKRKHYILQCHKILIRTPSQYCDENGLTEFMLSARNEVKIIFLYLSLSKPRQSFA